ncbi:hypothetical protein McanMca71_006412 [Microsporum canis]|uniref:Aminoglycoside phosphotransferase domain-containing protein n=1 Tax=Arthroderma otae (strain ATCC MYA-4605 / CBS 113480) TaxID=554155 RepID=C5FR17_ARTOC|nr:conserved hypothetical protein [Microsporum canis CBS 113480]EEQ32320.1 conserved hypothetical protein [Microsporum canis CBS 113480]
MAIWFCDIEDCKKPAVRTHGECPLCDRHLCSAHLEDGFHSCPTWNDEDAYDPAARDAEEKEITSLFQKVNISALISRATLLRSGIPCQVTNSLHYDRASRSSVMGGMNYHIELQFDDGVSWIARIRRTNATSPPPKLRDAIIASEVSTLRFLENLKIPTPRVFDFVPESESTVGVGYILMEKMPGKSLRWDTVPDEQKRIIMGQLADVYIELEKYPFQSMGSLRGLKSPTIGSFARESLTERVDEKIHAVGPCLSRNEYLKESIRLILNLILGEEMYTARAVDAYVIHLFLLDSIDAVCSAQAVPDNGLFYLKHADDKGDHILVDGDHNITAIIDWEWAYTTSKSIAFNSPMAFFPVGDFYDGATEPGEGELLFAQLLEEKGCPELANIVSSGRIQHHFEFCCGYDLVTDWDGFLGLFGGLRRALGGVDGGLDWRGWRERALIKYNEDEGLRTLISRQRN